MEIMFVFIVKFVKKMLLKQYNVLYSTIQQVFNDDNPRLTDDEDELFMIKFFDQDDFVIDTGEKPENELDLKI